MIKISLIISLIIFSTCSQSEQSENPDCTDELIIKFQNEPVGNPPQSIWRYEYNGETVYYIPPQCCDQYSILQDAECEIICAPDGGFTGHGDGNCPDFFTNRTDEKLVWKDSRIE
jgi:hypothetical protein